jgi:hypothetical protein
VEGLGKNTRIHSRDSRCCDRNTNVHLPNASIEQYRYAKPLVVRQSKSETSFCAFVVSTHWMMLGIPYACLCRNVSATVMLCHVGLQFRGSVNVKVLHICPLCLIPCGSIAG